MHALRLDQFQFVRALRREKISRRRRIKLAVSRFDRREERIAIRVCARAQRHRVVGRRDGVLPETLAQEIETVALTTLRPGGGNVQPGAPGPSPSLGGLNPSNASSNVVLSVMWIRFGFAIV